MEIKYQCQKQIQYILERIKPVTNHFEVSAQYLNGLDNDTFIKGFCELREILVDVYRDMQAFPEEYGLILVGMDVSEYKNSKPRDSRASALRLIALLHNFGRAAELIQNSLQITPSAFQEMLKIKHVGFSWSQNAHLILNKLSDFGFEFIGVKGKSFDKKAERYVLSYPDNPVLMNVLKGYAMSIPVMSHVPKELINIDYYTLEDMIPDEPVSLEFSVPLKEKETELLNKLFSDIPKDYIDVCRELVEYAVTLGYMPYQTKSSGFGISFTSKKTNRTLIALSPTTGLNYKKFIPALRILFSATKNYSDIFHEAVKEEIESHGGIYVGCYGCGKCSGGQDSYVYIYPDGRSTFKCRDTMMSPDWRSENMQEIMEMMKTQNDFWMK